MSAKYKDTPDILGNVLGNGEVSTNTLRGQLRYDYSEIDPDQRVQVQDAAIAIVRAERKATDSMVDIGQRLATVKDLVPHGQFMDWCRIEFQMSPSTVENMINVARVFGSKSQTFGILSDSALYLLASPSTPEAAREEALEIATSGSKPPTVSTVKAVIAKHKRAAAPVTVDVQAEHQFESAVAAVSERPEMTAKEAFQVYTAPSMPPAAQQAVAVAAAIQADADAILQPAASLSPDLPPDLAARGWQIKRVGDTGRWYCFNANGPKSTQPFDRLEDAIRAADGMQNEQADEQADSGDQDAPDAAAAYAQASICFDDAITELRSACRWLEGHHDELRVEIDVVIARVQWLIREVALD